MVSATNHQPRAVMLGGQWAVLDFWLGFGTTMHFQPRFPTSTAVDTSTEQQEPDQRAVRTHHVFFCAVLCVVRALAGCLLCLVALVAAASSVCPLCGTVWTRCRRAPVSTTPRARRGVAVADR